MSAFTSLRAWRMFNKSRLYWRKKEDLKKALSASFDKSSLFRSCEHVTNFNRFKKNDIVSDCVKEKE